MNDELKTQIKAHNILEIIQRGIDVYFTQHTKYPTKIKVNPNTMQKILKQVYDNYKITVGKKIDDLIVYNIIEDNDIMTLSLQINNNNQFGTIFGISIITSELIGPNDIVFVGSDTE